MKIRIVGVEMFHEDRWMVGQTDLIKLIVAFRNSVKVPTKLEQSL